MLYVVAGFILIFGGIVAAFILALVRRASKALVGTACLVAVLAGVTMLFQERVTKLTISGIGSIEAAVAQSTEDAHAISELRQRLEQLADRYDDLEASVGEAQQGLSTMKNAQKEAEAVLQDLRSFSDLSKTVMAAENDSREAWDQLNVLAADETFPLAADAAAAWSRIFEQHNQPFYASDFHIPWSKGVEPSAFSMGELIELYWGVPVSLKPALLEYIWHRTDIPRRTKMAFLVEILRDDPSLRAVEYAGRYFMQGAELEGSPMRVEYFMEWWSENQDQVED